MAIWLIGRDEASLSVSSYATSMRAPVSATPYSAHVIPRSAFCRAASASLGRSSSATMKLELSAPLTNWLTSVGRPARTVSEGETLSTRRLSASTVSSLVFTATGSAFSSRSDSTKTSWLAISRSAAPGLPGWGITSACISGP